MKKAFISLNLTSQTFPFFRGNFLRTVSRAKKATARTKEGKSFFKVFTLLHLFLHSQVLELFSFWPHNLKIRLSLLYDCWNLSLTHFVVWSEQSGVCPDQC